MDRPERSRVLYPWPAPSSGEGHCAELCLVDWTGSRGNSMLRSSAALSAKVSSRARLGIGERMTLSGTG
jgi:hypothetical protein